MPAQTRPPHAVPYESVLAVIGWTPLIRLNRVVGGSVTPVYGKAEFMNPGGSVKDRIGIAMIEAAEASGTLKAGGVIVEGTAGNTGVGLALAACVKGYRCIFTMPDKFSQEKIRLMRAFGAEVITTPSAVPPDHPDNYLNVARRVVEETPNAVMADQFYNPANPEAHYRTTGPEIWAQSGGRVTHFVGAAGTGGTVTGVARYLKEQNPKIKVVTADPQGSIYAHYHRTGDIGPYAPYKVEGAGNDKIPTTLDFDLVDEFRVVDDRDSYSMARRLTREEGLFVGSTSGLIVHAAVELAHELDDPAACIVCLLCDTGERYLSKLYSDEWMRENRMLIERGPSVEALLSAKPADFPELIAVHPSAAVRQALELIEANSVTQLPVMDAGECIGSVTESNLLARLVERPELIEVPVASLMELPLPAVDIGADFETVTKELVAGRPAVIIRRGAEPIGIVTRFDVVHYLTGIGYQEGVAKK
ncbi:MAG: pyridoxal-phosphate dependent enzyme [Gemmatimonadota bacterium]|nr:MAG: pyridoxal-phosphate dependent enzyme [Gemmatimonadota bacterium]